MDVLKKRDHLRKINALELINRRGRQIFEKIDGVMVQLNEDKFGATWTAFSVQNLVDGRKSQHTEIHVLLLGSNSKYSKYTVNSKNFFINYEVRLGWVISGNLTHLRVAGDVHNNEDAFDNVRING